MAVTKRRWFKEMLPYFCFTLPGACFPIPCVYLAHLYQGQPFKMADMVVDGGILAVAIGLYADAFSRLFHTTKWPELRIVLAAFALMATFFGSFFYGLRYVRGTTNSAVFVDLCVLVFILSVVIATFCRFLPEDYR